MLNAVRNRTKIESGSFPMSVFLWSTVWCSLLILRMSWPAAAVALNFWPSWLWSYNSSPPLSPKPNCAMLENQVIWLYDLASSNPVYARHVDSSCLGSSLSSHRQLYIGLVFTSRFIDLIININLVSQSSGFTYYSQPRRGAYHLYVTYSPFTFTDFSLIILVSIFRCSSSTTNPVYTRLVKSLVLDCSLSSHRHSYIHLFFSSRFIYS